MTNEMFDKNKVLSHSKIEDWEKKEHEWIENIQSDLNHTPPPPDEIIIIIKYLFIYFMK